MPEHSDADPVHEALTDLRADAERAWRQRECVPAATLWKVALGLGPYAPAEDRHVQGCPHCRRREEEVRQVARLPGLRGEYAPRPLAADLPLKAGATAAGIDPFPAPQRLSFAADPHLSVQVTRDRDGAWLEINHGKWPAGTLLRLALGGPQPWTALVLLHPGDGGAAARVRLREPLFRDSRPRPLTVQPIPAAALNAADVPNLRAAFAVAAQDEPSRTAWQNWAQQALLHGQLPAEVRAAAEEIRGAARSLGR